MQNEMIDRLVELIDDFIHYENVNDLNSDECKEGLADYLIENGVVVLDTDILLPENRPLIITVAGMPLNEVIELIKAKREGRIIVPPCKVGDTVYYISERYTECTAYREQYNEYSCSGCDVYCDSIKERYIVKVEINNIHWIFNMWEEFGKTVFLTKEEAEKALKERNSDN